MAVVCRGRMDAQERYICRDGLAGYYLPFLSPAAEPAPLADECFGHPPFNLAPKLRERLSADPLAKCDVREIRCLLLRPSTAGTLSLSLQGCTRSVSQQQMPELRRYCGGNLVVKPSNGGGPKPGAAQYGTQQVRPCMLDCG